MPNPPTSDDVKELTRAVNRVADQLVIITRNNIETAKIDAEIVASLNRLINEMHQINYTLYRQFPPPPIQPYSPPPIFLGPITTGD